MYRTVSSLPSLEEYGSLILEAFASRGYSLYARDDACWQFSDVIERGPVCSLTFSDRDPRMDFLVVPSLTTERDETAALAAAFATEAQYARGYPLIRIGGGVEKAVSFSSAVIRCGHESMQFYGPHQHPAAYASSQVAPRPASFTLIHRRVPEIISNFLVPNLKTSPFTMDSLRSEVYPTSLS